MRYAAVTRQGWAGKDLWKPAGLEQSLLYTPSWFSNLICCCCSVVISIKLLLFSYFTRITTGTDTGVVGDYDHNFNTKSIIKIICESSP